MRENPKTTKQHDASSQMLPRRNNEADGGDRKSNSKAIASIVMARGEVSNGNGQMTSAPKNREGEDRNLSEDLKNSAALKAGPDWNEWHHSRPPICKLWECVYLAHNIVTNRDTFARLRNQSDARVKGLQKHINTVIKAVKNNDPLLLYLGDLPKPERNVELFLPSFVEWAEAQGWENIPAKLIALKDAYQNYGPPAPKNWASWAKRPHLTIEEAICLNHNADPTVLKDSKARLKYQRFFERFDCDVDVLVRTIGRQLSSKRPALERASIARQATTMMLDPVEFVEHATQCGWEVHSMIRAISADTKRQPWSPVANTEGDVSRVQELAGKDRGQLYQKNHDATLGALFLMLIDVMRHTRDGAAYPVDDFFFSSNKINQLKIASKLTERYFSNEEGKSPAPGTVTERIRAGLKDVDGRLVDVFIEGKGWAPSKD